MDSQSSSGDDDYDSQSDSISALLAQTTQNDSVECSSPGNVTLFSSLSQFFDQSPPPQSSGAAATWPQTPVINSGEQSFAAQSVPGSVSLAAAEQEQSDSAPPSTAATAVAPKNSRKRSRASRRAPTTVLTTDTTNFRAMVQEFTGIPAPPFTSSPYSAAGFDFIRQSPPYLRRPFPQKIQPQPPFFPSILASPANNISSGSDSRINPPSNPLFSQSTTLLGISSNTSQIKINGFLDEFPQPNSTLAGLPSLISPTEISSAAVSRRSDNIPASWDGGGGARSKPNFQGYKSPENMAAGSSRGEGMMESWICSSE